MTKPFAHDLIGEIDRVLATIDQLAERMHRAVTTARDLAALAKRYVEDGERSDEELTDVLVRAEHAVHKAEQRRIEEGETTDALRSVNAASGPLGEATSLLMGGVASMLAKRNADLGVTLDADPKAEPPKTFEGKPISRPPGEFKHAGFFIRDMEAHDRGEEKYFDVAEIGDAMAAEGALDAALKEAYNAPFQNVVDGAISIEDRARGSIMADKIDATKLEDTVQQDESNPRQSPGEEKTEAASPPAPQSDGAASVDPIPEPEGHLIAPALGQGGDKAKASAAPKIDQFYEDVMDLWSTTDRSETLIAKKLNATVSLVRHALEQARIDGDERISARDEKGRLKSRRPKGAEPAPTADDGISTGVCVVDLKRNLVIGLKGMWTTSAENCRVVAFLNDGNCYRVASIAEECGWDVGYLGQCMREIMEQLQNIGVQLTATPGIGWKMKTAV